MSADRNSQVTRLLKRGLNHYGLGDVEAAIECWERARGLDPENQAVHDYLESAYQERGGTSLVDDDPTPLTTDDEVATRIAVEVEPPMVEAIAELEPVAEPKPLAEPKPAAELEFLAEPEPGAELELELEVEAETAPQPADRPQRPRPSTPASETVGPGTATTQPPGADSVLDPDGLIEKALDAYKTGELDLAWKALQRVSKADPERLDVQGYLQLVGNARADRWAKEIGDQGRMLRQNCTTQEMMKLKLHPEEGYLLSQIDGKVSIADLLSLSTTSRHRTLEMLARLLREKIVA